MTNIKKIITLGAVVLTVGVTSITAFAASTYKTPAEAAAGVTGRTVEEVIAEKTETGKTYGTIAKDAEKLEEFEKEMFELKKDIIAENVTDGILTQGKADEILNAIEENQKICDGTGTAKIGQEYGAGFGKGSGRGMKNSSGQGQKKGTCEGECDVQ